MNIYAQDIFKSAGFDVVQTGGCCEAWEKHTPGLRVLITDDTSPGVDTPEQAAEIERLLTFSSTAH